MSEDKKPFYKSKTLIVNLLLIGGLLLTELGNVLSADQNLSLIVVLNIILRLITKSELKLK